VYVLVYVDVRVSVCCCKSGFINAVFEYTTLPVRMNQYSVLK
jgi:hypothetical protein